MKTFKIEKCTARKVRLLFGLGITESGLFLLVTLLAVLLLISTFTFLTFLIAFFIVLGSFLLLSFLEQKQLFKHFFDQQLPITIVNDLHFFKPKNQEG
ncbi:hypothetical protein [Flexithrix dorotheae]|uniref:hypothetical protein n=1 Tax=Flexithrix dorotheae TaxID=70993 RepID=UPI000381C876|nr:hypothetical protein [Flexithrix dorotheae]